MEAPLSENGGWLGRQGLIDALDAYVAMSVPPKPVNGAQKGTATRPVSHDFSGGKKIFDKTNKVNFGNGQHNVSRPSTVPVTKYCYSCG